MAFLTKTAMIHSTTPNVPPSLGFWRSWSLLVGSAIGSGVFLMPTVLAPYGGLGVVSVVVAGLGGLCIALTLAGLSRRVNGSGGPYAYARAGLGDFGGFLTAWVYWVSLWVGGSAVANAIPGYLAGLLPHAAASPTLALCVTLLIVWSSVAINGLGVKVASIVGLTTTLLKLIPLVVIATAGLFLMDRHILPRMNPGAGQPFAAFAAAFTLAFWSYTGIEAATVPADDVVDAQETISRATVIGTLTVIGIYLFVTVAAMGIIPAAQLAASGSPLTIVGARIAGRLGSVGVAFAALVSLCTALHYSILLSAQIAMAAARDGLFPRAFRRRTNRGTPGIALAVAGLLITALIIMNWSKGLVHAYTFITLIATLATVIPYAFCAMAALVVPGADLQARGARIRSSAIAILAFGVAFLAAAGAGSDAVYWFMLLLLAGMPVYVCVTRLRSAEPKP
jgi:basic amino acid/polyamine antiporter, APA family